MWPIHYRTRLWIRIISLLTVLQDNFWANHYISYVDELCVHVHCTAPGTPAVSLCTGGAAPVCAPPGSAQGRRSAGSSPGCRSEQPPPPCQSHTPTHFGSRPVTVARGIVSTRKGRAQSCCCVAELTRSGVCDCWGGTGNVICPSSDSVVASSGCLTPSTSSFLHKLGCVLIGGSISPHILIYCTRMTALISQLLFSSIAVAQKSKELTYNVLICVLPFKCGHLSKFTMLGCFNTHAVTL